MRVAEGEGEGGIIEGGGRASNGAPRVRAFIIMIILDIPCLKQGQPASQPACETFPPFLSDINIIFARA